MNDAKNLLQNQSAQLQPLPYEPGTDTPEPNPPHPDASTESPSDAAPKAKKSGIVRRTTQPKITGEVLTFILEYAGRQMLATCRENLRWARGTDKPAWSLRGEHDCEYMPFSG